MTLYEIPLSSGAQTFDIDLQGVTYNLRLTWCAPGISWLLDIADVNNVPMVQGIPLVTGVNLLAQYPDLGIGGELIVATDANPGAVPTYENLGNAGHLYFAVSP